MGYYYKPLRMASIYTLRRYGSNRRALSNTLVSLCLQSSPMYKDGGRLVKIVYCDQNQFDEILLSFDSSYYESQHMESEPWIDEPGLMQAYRVTDITHPHVTSYIRPTRDCDMDQLNVTPRHFEGEHEWWNNPNTAVEATVDAFHNQMAHIILNTESPLLDDGSSSMQLTRQHIAPNDKDEFTCQSTRQRAWCIVELSSNRA